ncbi:hypothetical protein MT418_000653 [Batrachochytrium dendrobatidis]
MNWTTGVREQQLLKRSESCYNNAVSWRSMGPSEVINSNLKGSTMNSAIYSSKQDRSVSESIIHSITKSLHIKRSPASMIIGSSVQKSIRESRDIISLSAASFHQPKPRSRKSSCKSRKRNKRIQGYITQQCENTLALDQPILDSSNDTQDTHTDVSSTDILDDATNDQINEAAKKFMAQIQVSEHGEIKSTGSTCNASISSNSSVRSIQDSSINEHASHQSRYNCSGSGDTNQVTSMAPLSTYAKRFTSTMSVNWDRLMNQADASVLDDQDTTMAIPPADVPLVENNGGEDVHACRSATIDDCVYGKQYMVCPDSECSESGDWKRLLSPTQEHRYVADCPVETIKQTIADGNEFKQRIMDAIEHSFRLLKGEIDSMLDHHSLNIPEKK